MRTTTGLLAGLLLAGAAGLLSTLPPVAARPAAPLIPNDPGWSRTPGGWADLQWNFAGPNGVDAPGAWGNVAAAGRPGGQGVTVAVLDTGVAYPDGPAHPGSPDLAAARIEPGHDFVDHDDEPYDENGHGTHVASTIAEQTGNGTGLTGLAYGVTLLPVRVLDRTGSGAASTIALGVRYAADHGADIVNLSLNFRGRDPDPAGLHDLGEELAYAHDRGTLIVVGTGNDGASAVAYPASDPNVLAVGATTETGCLAAYSNHGAGVDIVAPGGGADANVADDHDCRPGWSGPAIFQTTRGPGGRFDLIGYTGTSMAAPHVSAAAALVIASGVLGRDPAPMTVERRLELTARDLGATGYDTVFGWGLLDAGSATTP
jgi:serine protease